MVPTLLLVSVMVFVIMRLLPGDVVKLMFPISAMPRAWPRCGRGSAWTCPSYSSTAAGSAGLLRGDLGESLWTQRPVLSVLAERLPVTLELGLLVAGLRRGLRRRHRRGRGGQPATAGRT